MIISSFRVMVQELLVSMEMLLFLMKALNLSMIHQDFFPWWVAFSIIHPTSGHFTHHRELLLMLVFEWRARSEYSIKDKTNLIHAKRCRWPMTSPHIMLRCSMLDQTKENLVGWRTLWHDRSILVWGKRSFKKVAVNDVT